MTEERTGYLYTDTGDAIPARVRMEDDGSIEFEPQFTNGAVVPNAQPVALGNEHVVSADTVTQLAAADDLARTARVAFDTQDFAPVWSALVRYQAVRWPDDELEDLDEALARAACVVDVSHPRQQEER